MFISEVVSRIIVLPSPTTLLNASSAIVSFTSAKWTVSISIASVVMLSNEMALGRHVEVAVIDGQAILFVATLARLPNG